MRKPFLLLIATTLLTTAFNSHSRGDKLEANKPDKLAAKAKQTSSLSALDALRKRLHWYGQASFRLDGPPTIYFDPVVNFKSPPIPADIILITHAHRDHYHAETLKKISSAKTVLVTIPAVADILAKDGVPGQVHSLQPGERTTVGEYTIEGVAAYNIDKRYHPKESGNLGFIITLDGVRLYHAGDTDAIPEMVDYHPDVAMIPIGGTYTMNPEQAVEAVGVLKPQVVVPMHILSESNLAAFRRLCKCEMWVMEVET